MTRRILAMSIKALAQAGLALSCAVALAATADAASKNKSTDKEGKPLRGTIHYKGGYTYKYAPTQSTDWRFIDPGATRQSPGGPFDNGFFFDSGVGAHGGYAPYQN